MLISEKAQREFKSLASSIQFSTDIFSLQAESITILKTLGIAYAFGLSHQQDVALTSAFAQNLAQRKQGGWFAIDTALAALREDTKAEKAHFRKRKRLERAQRFFAKRADKQIDRLQPQEISQLDSAIHTAAFIYNVTLRGDETKLLSPYKLRACRRFVKASPQRFAASLAQKAA